MLTGLEKKKNFLYSLLENFEPKEGPTLIFQPEWRETAKIVSHFEGPGMSMLYIDCPFI